MTVLHIQEHPFLGARGGTRTVRGGQTIEAMLRESIGGMEVRDRVMVHVGLPRRPGESPHAPRRMVEVPREHWARLRPKPGTEIRVTAMPAGDNARSILLLVVAVAATMVTGGLAAGGWTAFGLSVGTTAALSGMVVSLLGNALVNAAFPPPSMGSPTGTQGRWNEITGTGNAFIPNGPIPCLTGFARWFPTHAARPYSEALGEKIYHHYCFELGRGNLNVPLNLVKIGDTLAESFDEVEMEVGTTSDLFRNDVNEVAIGAALEDPEAPDPPTYVERTTAAGIDGWSVDLLFPGGLFGVGTSGKDFAVNVYLDIEVRDPATSGTYVPLTSLTGVRLAGIEETGNPAEPYRVRAMNKTPFSVGFGQDLDAPGQLDVRIARIRTEHGSDDNTHVDTLAWRVLRSINYTEPSRTGTNKLFMRIKATDQFTGQLGNVSVYGEQLIPVYDEGTETWTDTATDNTGWVGLWLLRGCPAYANHVEDSRIDFDSWFDYVDFCTTHNLRTNAVLDSRITAADHIDDVLTNSLARLNPMVNGKYGVMFDDGTKTSEFDFTELETGNFSWTRTFSDLPDGLRVRFRNADANWAWDEIVVVRDGFSWRGLGPRGDASADPEAESFESVELRQIDNAQQAWMFARLQLAQGELQQSVATWDSDIAGIRWFRGNVVTVPNPVVEWGVGAGWVREVDGTTVRLTDMVETEAGLSYYMQARRVNASGEVVNTEVYGATPHSIRTDTFYLDSAPTDLAPGDVGIIGQVGEEPPLILITDRFSRDDLNFSFQGVEYTPAIAAYWADPPAVILSEITEPPGDEGPDPPSVTDPVSDPDGDDTDNAGIPTTTIRIGVYAEAGRVGKKSEITGREVRYRLAGADPATGWKYRIFPKDEPIKLKGVLSGEAYDIEIRNLGKVPSGWTVLSHTVAATTREGARALPPVSVGNVGSRWVSGAAVTWEATDTLADISMAAGDLQVGPDIVSYSAASAQVAGTASETKTVHLYFDDPKWLGGARTLGVTEDITQTSAAYGRVYVASLVLTFAASGGPATSGGGGIGGGGGGSGTIEP